jgi:hypothetical protein
VRTAAADAAALEAAVAASVAAAIVDDRVRLGDTGDGVVALAEGAGL